MIDIIDKNYKLLTKYNEEYEMKLIVIKNYLCTIPQEIKINILYDIKDLTANNLNSFSIDSYKYINSIKLILPKSSDFVFSKKYKILGIDINNDKEITITFPSIKLTNNSNDNIELDSFYLNKTDNLVLKNLQIAVKENNIITPLKNYINNRSSIDKQCTQFTQWNIKNPNKKGNNKYWSIFNIIKKYIFLKEDKPFKDTTYKDKKSKKEKKEYEQEKDDQEIKKNITDEESKRNPNNKAKILQDKRDKATANALRIHKIHYPKFYIFESIIEEIPTNDADDDNNSLEQKNIANFKYEIFNFNNKVLL